MRKNTDFLPTQEDLYMIYKYPDDYKGKQKQPYDTFMNMFQKFPTFPEEV